MIKKLWLDPLENRDAWGYENCGYVDTEVEAIEIANSEFKVKSGWPLDYIPSDSDAEVPVYKYEKIESFKY
jgi:hypothetical protein